MEHKCDENNLVLVAEQGTLITYKCPVCGQEFYELGSIIPDSKPLRKCKLYAIWSKQDSIVKQINTLKNIIPSLKKQNNVELLTVAKKSEKLYIGEMYLSEAQELTQVAKKHNIILVIEEL